MLKTLTDRLVAGLRLETRDDVFDTKARGLVLRVGARRKVWYFTCRNRGPRQRLRLGEYPALSLADARKQVTNNAHCSTRASTLSRHDRRPLMHQRRNRPPSRSRTSCRSSSRFRRAADRLDALVGQGLTVGVNRIQALIGRLFTVALDRGQVDAHPAARILKRFKENARTRVLTDDEIRTVWAGLDARPGVASDALRLRLLLGQRGEEPAGMLRAEVDIDAATWTLSSGRTKNKRQHILALPPSAHAIVSARYLAGAEDEKRIFPGLDLTGDEHKALNTIHGGAYEWTDLRRTVATRLAGLGYDETTIGRVLNHARYTVTAKHYNQHAYVEEIRGALTAWDRELQRVLANEPKRKTPVLPMRRRS